MTIYLRSFYLCERRGRGEGVMSQTLGVMCRIWGVMCRTRGVIIRTRGGGVMCRTGGIMCRTWEVMCWTRGVHVLVWCKYSVTKNKNTTSKTTVQIQTIFFPETINFFLSLPKSIKKASKKSIFKEEYLN